MDAPFLNHILVQLDIMQTGCGWLEGSEVMGELEYMPEAQAILQLLATGNMAREAVTQAFAARFDAAQLAPAKREEYLLQLTETLEVQQRLDVYRNLNPVLLNEPLDANTMSLLLWQADLMRTGCNVQEWMTDEYSDEAYEIIKLLDSGMNFPTALNQVFDEYFWAGCLQSKDRLAELQPLLDTVNALTDKASSP